MSNEKSNKGGKHRIFAAELYPESAPADWLDKLDALHLPAFVSPCHNQDVNDDGTRKKEHYHIMLMYDGPVYAETARTAFNSFGAAPNGFIEAVKSGNGYARYLCHLDERDPHKYHYSVEEVKSFGGADYVSFIVKPADKYQAIKDMIDYCRDNNIVEYCDILDYARNNREDWFRCLCDSSTFVIKEYLKSRRYKGKISP